MFSPAPPHTHFPWLFKSSLEEELNNYQGHLWVDTAVWTYCRCCQYFAHHHSGYHHRTHGRRSEDPIWGIALSLFVEDQMKMLRRWGRRIWRMKLHLFYVCTHVFVVEAWYWPQGVSSILSTPFSEIGLPIEFGAPWSARPARLWTQDLPVSVSSYWDYRYSLPHPTFYVNSAGWIPVSTLGQELYPLRHTL